MPTRISAAQEESRLRIERQTEEYLQSGKTIEVCSGSGVTGELKRVLMYACREVVKNKDTAIKRRKITRDLSIGPSALDAYIRALVKRKKLKTNSAGDIVGVR